jgi:hypothetical protein
VLRSGQVNELIPGDVAEPDELHLGAYESQCRHNMLVVGLMHINSLQVARLHHLRHKFLQSTILYDLQLLMGLLLISLRL